MLKMCPAFRERGGGGGRRRELPTTSRHFMSYEFIFFYLRSILPGKSGWFPRCVAQRLASIFSDLRSLSYRLPSRYGCFPEEAASAFSPSCSLCAFLSQRCRSR